MSDSDELPSNVFTFRNENTTVSARGPNINASNIGLSFRSNVLTSTMNMPRNFERQRYTESSYDQRSMYYRRNTSPMSVHSACDIRARNVHNSYYTGMSSQRSIVNGRSGSPMSFRSADTNASVSAADIAMAFKNVKFNKYDLRVIKEAYNKYMRSRVRRRIEKRRNLRLFLKGNRRKSGYDSGEQGSDSSISSDDCRSIKTTGFKESMSSCRSTKTDLTDFRKTIRESNMYRDCTENVKQNTFRNIVAVSHENANNNNSQNYPTYTQKDRFKDGFLLPSRRFNRSVAASAIPEYMERIKKYNMSVQNKNKKLVGSAACETDSDQEEIFAERKKKENSTQNIEPQRKRSIDSDDMCLPDRKRSKISPIFKECTKAKTTTSKQPNDNVTNNNDFVFAKPSFPIKKSANTKTKEKLISKSSQPLLDKTLSKNAPNTLPSTSDPMEDQVQDESEIKQISTSDVSMRPSFIKRKLFTQKLDVTEKKNVSCDSLGANSPQSSVYGAIQNEKHKARKLVTQSCLRREVQDDNNLIDLIHKIVPPERMSVTNQTNKTGVQNDKNNSEDLDDKWDVTSIISTCNNDNVSDTYTDEEILQVSNNSDIMENTSRKPVQNVEVSQCKILLDKLPANVLREQQNEQLLAMEKNHFTKKQVQTKSFWDTDFESDFECPTAPRLKSDLKENYKKANNLQEATPYQVESNPILNKIAPITEITKSQNNTLDSVQKLNITNLRIRSHRTPKRKKCCIEMHKPEERIAAVSKPQINKQASKENPKNTEKNNNLLNKPNKVDTIGTKKVEADAVNDKNKRKPNTKNKTKALNKEIDSTSNGTKNNIETCLEGNNIKRKQGNKNKKANKQVNKSSGIDSSITDISNSKTDHGNNDKRKLNMVDKTKSYKLSKKSSRTDSTFDATKNDLTETDLENNNKSSRPLRSCRTSKQNSTLDASKIDQSMDYKSNLSNRSLRSRQIDLSSSFNKEKDTDKSKKKTTNNPSTTNKNNKQKSRQSDISFSLVCDKKYSLKNLKNTR